MIKQVLSIYILALTFFCLSPVNLFSQEIPENYLEVPDEYENIQAAIDNSQNGDVVIVKNGLYKESISYGGKSIIVASLFYIDGNTSHISNTKISGREEDVDQYVIKFNSAEDTGSVLIGFTVDTHREGSFYYGGGIKCENASPKLSKLIISNNNLDYTKGTGISLYNSNAVILDVLVLENFNGNFGAAIYAEKSNFILENSKIKNNKSYWVGAGIYLEDSDAKITSTKFSGNRSDYEGGAIYCINSDPIITDCDFIANTSTLKNPVIYIKNSNPVLSGLKVFNNDSHDPSTPSEATIKADSSIILASELIFKNNKANGIRVNNSSLYLSNSEFQNNNIGILVYGGYAEINNTTVEYHREFLGSRGLILNSCEFKIDSLICSKNGPGDGGTGGIGISNSTGTIENSRLYKNHCGGHGDGGAGMYAWNSDILLRNVLLAENIAYSDMPGSGIYIDSSIVQIENSTIAGNQDESAALYNINGSEITISNSILWGNSPNHFYDTNGVSVSYSNIEGGWEGEGNINSDPMFCYTGIGDYQLSSLSQCAGSGKDGIDIGAYGIGCTEVSVDEESSKQPEKYSLSQNYPNPFNPSTVIKYSLPKTENVTLKVFDILGREVAVLVNEFKQAGTYSVEFNGSGLSSGVYIFQIKAGTYSATKKMILSK